MTPKEILIKSIEKAQRNGWMLFNDVTELQDYELEDGLQNYDVYGLKLGHPSKYVEDHWSMSIRDIIFSHDFAKAFWGIEKVCNSCGAKYNIEDMFCTEHGSDSMPCYYDGSCEKWEWCLREMILQEDPLKYLEKFL